MWGNSIPFFHAIKYIYYLSGNSAPVSPTPAMWPECQDVYIIEVIRLSCGLYSVPIP